MNPRPRISWTSFGPVAVTVNNSPFGNSVAFVVQPTVFGSASRICTISWIVLEGVLPGFRWGGASRVVVNHLAERHDWHGNQATKRQRENSRLHGVTASPTR